MKTFKEGWDGFWSFMGTPWPAFWGWFCGYLLLSSLNRIISLILWGAP